MSFWQRVGRAGRGKEGLALFLPSANSALDLYYAEHPEGKDVNAASTPLNRTLASALGEGHGESLFQLRLPHYPGQTYLVCLRGIGS